MGLSGDRVIVPTNGEDLLFQSNGEDLLLLLLSFFH
jgi:hypothetical protein